MKAPGVSVHYGWDEWVELGVVVGAAGEVVGVGDVVVEVDGYVIQGVQVYTNDLDCVHEMRERT